MCWQEHTKYVANILYTDKSGRYKGGLELHKSTYQLDTLSSLRPKLQFLVSCFIASALMCIAFSLGKC